MKAQTIALKKYVQRGSEDKCKWIKVSNFGDTKSCRRVAWPTTELLPENLS